jgi:hypothetical protein
MPVTESVEYAKFNTIGLKNRPDSIQAEGRARFLNDEVVFVGDESSSDAVSLLPLPKGALVDLARSFIIGGAMSGVSVDIGTSGSTDNLADGVSLASAGSRPFDASEVNMVEVTGDGGLTLTVAGGSPAAVSQRVSVCYYVR